MAKKLSIDFIREQFSLKGLELLSDVYENANTPLRFKCSNGHEHQLAWKHFNKGAGCAQCSRIANKGKKRKKRTYTLDTINKKRVISDIEVSFSSENYKILSMETLSGDIFFMCPQGHIHKTNFSNWKKGKRCGICANKHLTIQDIKRDFESEGYTVLSSKYENAKEKIHFICNKGHEHSISYDSWNNGNRCGKCSNNHSKAEIEIKDFLVSKGLIVSSTRKIIPPYELDLVIEDKKVAIEYCGLFWHSEKMGKKERNYHLKKLKLCTDQGYKLITIFEDEFVKHKGIVLSRISNLLGITSSTRIFARNCEIKEITKEAINFLKENHLQGCGQSNIKLGAFYNNELVSVMTFSKPSVAKNAENIKDVWELNRFSSKVGYNVVGIASKFVKFFEKKFTWAKITTFADRRWSDGNLYHALGFSLLRETEPNYWYLDKGYANRTHRFVYRKRSSEPKNKTEWEIRQEQGLDRIWDCGSFKFEKVNSIY